MIGFLTRRTTIAEALRRPYDNFAVLRLCLALAVVVSHAFSVTTGAYVREPLHALTGSTLGEHAVNGFFALSGFLVTMSYARRGPRDYAVARLLRIAPGFVVATLVTGLALGAALTRLPLGAYLASDELRHFLVSTLTEFRSRTALPGVFETNPLRFPLGTVWTLRYEVLCYLGVLVLGLAGALARRWAVSGLVAALTLAVAGLDLTRPDALPAVHTALRLTLIFAAGGALYLWRDRAWLSPAVLLALLLLGLVLPGFLLRAWLYLTTVYAVIWLALAPGLSHPLLDLRHDLSYGVYLYGWPLQQSLVQLFPAASAMALLGPSLLLTLLVAALSWFGVERPAMRLKARLLGARRPASP